LYGSPNVIRVIKSRRISTHRRVENAYRIVVGKPKGKRAVGRSEICGKIILDWILVGK
jgi:hypothetical protein